MKELTGAQPPNIHVMVDLETMGKGSYAAIVSIGAAKFDPAGDGVIDTFYQAVTLASSLKAGLRTDADTILWWLRQSPEAREALQPVSNTVDLDEALLGFSEWYGDDDSVPVWGNGATFDNVIMSNAYTAVGIDKPWNYAADRCFRTLRALRPQVQRPSYGDKHNALDDAIAQVRWLQDIVKLHGVTL